MPGSLPAQVTIKTQPPRDQLAANGFSAMELSNIRGAIKNKYQGVATSAEGMFRYLTGKAGALQLGYDESLMADIPERLITSFCGVGNPFAIKDIAPGSCLLDIGCGGGFDLIVARRIVGDTGRVAGIDLTAEMLKRAGLNFAEMGINDIETRLVESEEIPYAANSFDVVISNGVINLSPLKLDLFREIFRVLRPGGRLQFADIVLDKELPPMLANSLESWVQ